MISSARWISLSVVMLAGCTSYQAPAAVYYAAPCDTPGAIPSGMLNAAIPRKDDAKPTAEKRESEPAPANEKSANPSPSPACIVIAEAAPRGQFRRYGYGGGYGRGYYYNPYGPFYGSFGFSYFGGGHIGGGHLGGGHFGGGHHGSSHH